ncbi:suppressor of fused domain protein [Halobacillus yeomjeoni]|uniref:suppressor of fused domain protein n=1 Tax=Halobacillus yeomjeoni TaxID=311194 RepID=UPI001CD72E14|nr:suppressor of fused domain protein [Halobacillus yeomjeoni]MCA0983385.1 suppressor of fused domain protein [Halobacillus yeomjeoni]
MRDFIDFLEEHLGNVLYGWSTGCTGKKIPFQIAKYSDGPFQGTSTYTTIGLSDHLLKSTNRKEIRQELVIVSYTNFGDENIPGILQQVGMFLLKDHQALLRGDVIGPYGSLFKDSKLEALYASIPVYFPESFEIYDGGDVPIVMIWLIPIMASEARFVRTDGWEAFENMLEEVDPDLVDYQRSSVLLED